MNFTREQYLNKLVQLERNGRCKLIYSIRFCGRTQLFRSFINRLLTEGIPKSQILVYELGAWNMANLTEGARLLADLESRMKPNQTYYIILDDFHLLKHPEIVLQALAKRKELDLYLSADNMSMLDTNYIKQLFDVDVIMLHPVSYREYQDFFRESTDETWQNFIVYGGMPFMLNKQPNEEKKRHLLTLVNAYYIPHIADRHHIRNQEALSSMLHSIAAHTGVPSTYLQLSKAVSLSSATFKKHEQYLEDAFLINRAPRLDICKNRYFDSQAKFYFADHGICNACLQFTMGKDKLLETIVYNELLWRGFSVDTGVLEFFTKDQYQSTIRNRQNVDFIAHRHEKSYLIQLAISKTDFTEKHSTLVRIRLPYEKLLLCTDTVLPHKDAYGIKIMHVRDFLLSAAK